MSKITQSVKKIFQRIKEAHKHQQLASRNEIRVAKEDLHRVKIRIRGEGNVVHIGKLTPGSGSIEIRITGNGNRVHLAEGISVSSSLKISVGAPASTLGPVTDVDVSIGAGSGFESTSILTYNSHASIEIGERCMFSFGIQIYHTDGHAIMDTETGKIINPVRKLVIGNHVWVGAHVTIMKNTQIGNNCIVGWGAVISGRHPDSNCIYAGNPATLRKKGITWEVNGAKCGYIANEGTN